MSGGTISSSSNDTIVITKPVRNDYVVSTPGKTVVVGNPIRTTVEVKSEGAITNPINANDLVGTNLASSVVTTSITAVGTITSGQWAASTIAVNKGGTGATTAAGAKSNLGILGPVQVFTIPRFATTGQGKGRFYAPTNMTITNIRLSVGDPPVGASIIVDVNKNGSSIFTSGTRPTIPNGGYISATNVPVVTSLNAGDYLTVDVDQIGSSFSGAFLTVQIEFSA